MLCCHGLDGSTRHLLRLLVVVSGQDRFDTVGGLYGRIAKVTSELALSQINSFFRFVKQSLIICEWWFSRDVIAFDTMLSRLLCSLEIFLVDFCLNASR
jgi:hypothetical protein